MGKPCVVGCDRIAFDPSCRRAQVDAATIEQGDWISVDGDSGEVYLGRQKIVIERPEDELAEVDRWREAGKARPASRELGEAAAPQPSWMERIMRAIWIGPMIAALAVVGSAHVVYAQGAEFGKNEYVRSCAACHGVAGKGDGPVAKSLSKPPADLSKLSEANNGVFPVSRVYDVIDGRVEFATHGTRDMPVWGDVYTREVKSRVPRAMPEEMIDVMVRVRILGLIEYISTLQGK